MAAPWSDKLKLNVTAHCSLCKKDKKRIPVGPSKIMICPDCDPNYAHAG